MKKRGGKRNEVRIDDRSKEKRQKKKGKVYMYYIFIADTIWFWMCPSMYQDIANTMPKTVPTQATETELVPLKKGQLIENALFDVEDDLPSNQVSMKKKSISLDQFF